MPIRLTSVGGGQITVDAPNTGSNYTITLPASNAVLLNSDSALDAAKLTGSATLTSPAFLGTPSGVGVLTSGTAITVSGTAVEFIGIPSWAKRITVLFNGVSTTANAVLLIQIGSGSYTTTGYISSTGYITTASVARTTSTFGFAQSTMSNASTISGASTIYRVSGNTYVNSSVLDNTGGTTINIGSGTITLAGALDRIRIIGSTTGLPVDTFDLGTINIMYE